MEYILYQSAICMLIERKHRENMKIDITNNYSNTLNLCDSVCFASYNLLNCELTK